MKKLFPILIIITAISIGSILIFKNNPTPQISASVLRTGLIGYWTMDSNDYDGTIVLDKSGFGNNGTDVNMDTSNLTQGKIHQALDFNGSNEYINLGTYETPDVVSVSAWFKTTATGLRAIFDNQVAGALNSGIGLYIPGGNNLYCVADDGTSQLGIYNNDYIINDGEWHFVVCTVDASNLIKIYTDGVLDNSGSGPSGSIASSDAVVGIGLAPGVGSYWSGPLDEVMIWNRALSADEVAQIYNTSKRSHTNTAPRAGATGSSTGTLIGYWTMDGNDTNGTTVYDKSGFGNHGTFSNGLTPTSTSGKVNQSIDFNGTSDYINVGNQDSLNVIDAITISAWAYPDILSGTQELIIQYEANVGGYFLRFVGTGGSAAIVDGSGEHGDNAFATFETKKWQHIVMTYDGAKLSYYKDGVYQSKTDYVGSIGATSNNLAIGAIYSPTQFFNGKIDDVRIYDYALTADDVANLYNFSKRNYIASASKNGLAGYWTMNADDMNGTTIYDKSGRNNHGVLTNLTTADLIEGKMREAFDTDGSTEYILIDDAASSTYSNTDVITVSAWVNQDSNISGDLNYIVSNSTSPILSGYFLSLDSSNRIRFSINHWSTNAAYYDFMPIDGQWHHIVGTYDKGAASNQINVYMDGVAGTPDTYSTAISYPANTRFYIGETNLGSRGFDGKIDEVRVYSRVLSADEITVLYESSKRRYVN